MTSCLLETCVKVVFEEGALYLAKALNGTLSPHSTLLTRLYPWCALPFILFKLNEFLASQNCKEHGIKFI